MSDDHVRQIDKKITALCGGEALPRELADEITTRVGVLWNSRASGAFLAKPPPWKVTCWPGLTFGSPTTVALVCVVPPAVVVVVEQAVVLRRQRARVAFAGERVLRLTR